MNIKFSMIKAVGFDLDRTLYSDSPEIYQRVTVQVALAILSKKPELESVERIREIYEKEAIRLGSWPKVLEKLGFLDPVKVVHQSLERANIVEFIPRDEKLVGIVERLHAKYYLFLITGSSRSFAQQVLGKIGINFRMFQFSFFGDTRKKNLEVFRHFLEQSVFTPDEHVYIGDNPKTDIFMPRSLGMKTIAVGRCVEEADSWVGHIHEIEGLLL